MKQFSLPFYGQVKLVWRWQQDVGAVLRTSGKVAVEVRHIAGVYRNRLEQLCEGIMRYTGKYMLV